MKFIDAGSSGQFGWHATELAMKCPQAFAYRYRVDWGEGGRQTSSAPALLKGSLIHQGLAHYYARIRDGETDWATPDDAIDDCADKLGGDAHLYVDLAKKVVKAYAAHYAFDRLTPLHVEEVFEAEIAGYKFTQRLDFVARDASGKVVIIDHKTSAMVGGAVAQRYTLSGQFLGMAMFGRQIWDKEFGGVMINLISLPEGREPEFKRVMVDPAPNALRLFPLTVKSARDRVTELDLSGLSPWEWPKVLSETVCTSTYGNCEWYEKCRWGSAG